ncbi:hypothetical protein GALL_499810 [mine drainage metagenome]|uniref:Uncharacterized protein n=1 Tax=mine drainage metagenome TaxID=410659 RepID=A0A1J5PT25_9ZZZZ
MEHQHQGRDQAGQHKLPQGRDQRGEGAAKATGAAGDGGLGGDHQFGQQQQAEHANREADRLGGLIGREDREEHVRLWEVVRRGHEEGGEDRRDNEGEPQKGGDVGQDALQEDIAAPRFQAGGGEQARMLQVALTPAAVALGEVDDVFRAFLVRAFKVGIEADKPACAGQQGGLDIIVAEDVAAEGRLSRQRGQPAGGGKGLHAHDCIVAPERAGATGHQGVAAREDGREEAGRELLAAAKAGRGADHLGQRLQQAHGGLCLHPAHHLDDGGAFHQAVSVKDQCKVVGGAGAGKEVLDVAGLFAGVGDAAAVKDAPLGVAIRDEMGEPVTLCRRDVFVAGVGQDGEVKGVGLAQSL